LFTDDFIGRIGATKATALKR